MNSNNNVTNFGQENVLKELIMVVWRKKGVIVCITLIVALLTGIFSIFVLSPVYHTNMNVVLNMPEAYHTKYGDFALPITTNQQYIGQMTGNKVLINTINDLHNMGYSTDDLTIEGLRNNITINNETTTTDIKQNIFTINIAANSPEEARDTAIALYNNYIEFLDVQTAESAVGYFYDHYSVEIKILSDQLMSTQEILKKNEELLSDTPQTINQKEAMEAVKANTSDFVVLENLINPNYTKIENDIIENKQSINSMETSFTTYNNYLEELQTVKEGIAKYYETGVYEELRSSIVNISKLSVYLPSLPVAPSQKTSPSNAKNILLGTVLGGMLGLFTVLIQWWWSSYDENK